MNIHHFLQCQPWALYVDNAQLSDLKQDMTFYNILGECLCSFSYKGVQMDLFNSQYEECATYGMEICVENHEPALAGDPLYLPGLFLVVDSATYLVNHTAIEELAFPKPTCPEKLLLTQPQVAYIKFPNVTVHIRVPDSIDRYIAHKKLAAAAFSMNKTLKRSLLKHKSISMPTTKHSPDRFVESTPTTCSTFSTGHGRSPGERVVSADNTKTSLSPSEPLHRLHHALHKWMDVMQTSQQLLHPVIDKISFRGSILAGGGHMARWERGRGSGGGVEGGGMSPPRASSHSSSNSKAPYVYTCLASIPVDSVSRTGHGIVGGGAGLCARGRWTRRSQVDGPDIPTREIEDVDSEHILSTSSPILTKGGVGTPLNGTGEGGDIRAGMGDENRATCGTYRHPEFETLAHSLSHCMLLEEEYATMSKHITTVMSTLESEARGLLHRLYSDGAGYDSTEESDDGKGVVIGGPCGVTPNECHELPTGSAQKRSACLNAEEYDEMDQLEQHAGTETPQNTTGRRKRYRPNGSPLTVTDKARALLTLQSMRLMHTSRKCNACI